ncbi:lethal(3)malignant brain tumor-like protein 2 [Orbicella faveolata]|uniref:lethal(3)malignant brain tumor-like protein 2 n=1 Tax=Orbicella faveolata TaxID=48498 RepID=UPI0009E375EC|nr:lethal(3)malignant brain tumor-like protein 2 [Orbicella faveolata]
MATAETRNEDQVSEEIPANDEAPIPVNTAKSTGDVDAETKEKSSPSDLPLNMPMSEETSMPTPLQEEQSNIKGDTEAERQGEILAFYGEEETRNYDSPEPGPVIEKDDAATKETAGSEQVEKEPPKEEVPEDEPLAENMAKCEFCHYVGIRESFFSKSKRFCKMECAKRYSSASNIKQKSKGDKIGTPKKKHRTSDRHHKVSLKLDLLSNIVTVLSDTAKCEFCCYIGVREHFFSKSKRFCKMECAKRYSASNIKKKSKGEKIGTPKKKHRTSERHAHNTNALASASATTSSATTAATASSVQETVQDGHEEEAEGANASAPPLSREDVGENWQNRSFDWSEYLKKTGAKAAANHLFEHVSLSPCLKGVHVGMKVEVVNCSMDVIDDTDVAFWVATVIEIKHYRVQLRYEGYESNPAGDFWFDLRSKNIHPVGWCAKRNKLLIPPPAIRENCANWRDYLFKCLSGAKTFSVEFLQQLQSQPYNRFQKGMKVEVADRKNMYSMCVATIVDVIGDRLRMRYDGLDDDVAEDFWCHYQSSEIHPIGWSSLVGHTLQPPIGWKHSLSKWNEFLADDLANSLDAPQEFFVQDSTGTAPGVHQFKVGMKFEAIDPFNPSHVCVVTVIKVLKFNYFVLGVDSLATYFVCHANSINVFPCGWAKAHDLQLHPPRDYSVETFSWPEYLAKTGGFEAPIQLFRQEQRGENNFKVGTKLEAVDLREPALICPATVTDLKGPLLRIHFDGWDESYDQLVDKDSLDIFPVGYCSSVAHPLQPPGPMPDRYVERYGPVTDVSRPSVPRPLSRPVKRRASTEDDGQKKKAKSLYPQEIVYLNKRCYPGPLLSRDLMRSLPDAVRGSVVGPEKHNIMRLCMQHLVSASINPKQVLELFSREFYQSKKNRELQLGGTVCIETKSKNGKRLMRRVRVVNKAEHLQPYLQRVCQVLGCCSELVSATRYPMGHCNQTSCVKGKDNGVTSSSDGRPLQETTAIVPPPPSVAGYPPPGQKLHHNDSAAVWLQPTERDSSHDSMVSSTSNLPSSAAQESDAASVLLYQSSNSGKDPRLWNVQEVTGFMYSIGCSNYADAFIKEEIDGRALLLLTQEMLESLTENKLGPMTKIQSAVKALKQAWGI